MIVVYSEHDLKGTGHTGSAGNAPEERKRLVQKALRAPNKSSSKCTFVTVDAPEPTLAPLAGLVHDVNMLEFLESAWTRWEQEWRRKPNEHLKGVFCAPDSDANSPKPPPFIAGFFAPKEVAQQPSKSVLGQSCFYAMDRETPIHESTLPALKWDLAVTRESARLVSSKKAKVAYAQITHPGHHAGPSSYGGFCFINHAAITARLLQKQGGFHRVAVVDVDYHAGNGTQCAFWDDPNVFFASLHADPEHEYPFNAGFANQEGGPQAKGTKMNIPLPGNTDWPKYKKELARVVQKIKDFGAQALVVSLGVDTLRDDPVALPGSKFLLNPPDYAEMGEMLLHNLGLPTVVVQEGGYKLDDVPLAIAAFLTGSVPDKRSYL